MKGAYQQIPKTYDFTDNRAMKILGRFYLHF